jgi:hypothetical protein
MRRLFHKLLTYEKHRKVQLFVTVGTMTAAVIGLFIPEYSHASIIAGVATNMIWVWE